MSSMLLISRIVSKDPIQNLNFCYPNIGWLGLPVASALFDDSAAMAMIAAYIGNSLFGNSVGVSLMIRGHGLKSKILQTLKTPPMVALLIGLACMPFKDVLEEFGMPAYEILKFVMSFLGMAILGMWLIQVPLRAQDFKIAGLQFVCRSFTFFLLLSLFIVVCTYYDISLVTENKAALYLICLLPPAVNIIVMETYYMKSGRSASMIACGTCISILAIVVYIGFIVGARVYFG
jgi:malate permease and related proteins